MYDLGRRLFARTPTPPTTFGRSLPRCSGAASSSAAASEEEDDDAVYISEAEKYDKALVEGWRSDMEGLLIFAGLFSATLTAFLVESYKTLTPDQGAITIALLAQISRQLDFNSTTPSAHLSILAAPFTPTPASFACNTLWFLSLGLSLSCALMATLVEQWSREFVQRTERLESPVIRARIFSYLYFGLQRFGMHEIVDFIPLLLHMSLLLFLAGLVPFLHPINPLLAALPATLLVAITIAYMYLTVLPIISSDSPYRTPLSNVAWKIFQGFHVAFRRQKQPILREKSQIARESPRGTPTMVEVMVLDAVADSSARAKRDRRAVLWAVRSLADNNELESFVDALPDIMWGPRGRRRLYDQIIEMLLAGQDIQLVARIEGLLWSCDSGLMESNAETRRRISCLKALWTIAYLLASDYPARTSFPVFNAQILASQFNHSNPLVRSYSISAYSLVQWIVRTARAPYMWSAVDISPSVLEPPGSLLQAEHEPEAAQYSSLDLVDIAYHQTDLPQASPHIAESFQDTGYDSLLEYMRRSAYLPGIPYEFEATCQIIRPYHEWISPRAEMKLKGTLSSVVDQPASTIKALEDQVHQVDIIVGTIFSILQTAPDCLDAQVGRAMIKYMAPRKKGPGLLHALRRCDPTLLGSLLTRYIAGGAGNLTQNTLYTIWFLSVNRPPLAVFEEELLKIVYTAPQLSITPSVIAVLKSNLVTDASKTPPEQLHRLMDRLQISSPTSAMDTRANAIELWKQVPFAILIEFLEHDLAVPDPTAKHRASDTFRFLARRCAQRAALSFLQLRFATWFQHVIDHPALYSECDMIVAVIDWLYNSMLCEPFDDLDARRMIRAALTTYVATLPLQLDALRSRPYYLNLTIGNQIPPTDSSPDVAPLTGVAPNGAIATLDSQILSLNINSQARASIQLILAWYSSQTSLIITMCRSRAEASPEVLGSPKPREKQQGFAKWLLGYSCFGTTQSRS
ncbi:hypothetical protein GGX14DRAFT_540123 [Mycena pura]|uniref:DUF6535 domain-containing protein n=1 Tax=Mycena pura TaxID=153505 RepID=A0AAD6YPC9_9AGAR|nr:hypothetical protein GGX14DRAFT_540123 [Mycena pura]